VITLPSAAALRAVMSRNSGCKRQFVLAPGSETDTWNPTACDQATPSDIILLSWFALMCSCRVAGDADRSFRLSRPPSMGTFNVSVSSPGRVAEAVNAIDGGLVVSVTQLVAELNH
jgi:hypothetical protein